jgi:uncharacterized membrane protein
VCPVSILWRHTERGSDDYFKLSHALPVTRHLAHAIILRVTATDQSSRIRRDTFALTAVGVVGVLVAFIATVAAFVGIEGASGLPKLSGADIELGYPSSAFSMVLFVIALSVGAAQFAGASLGQGWWRALAAVFAIGVVFEIWAAYLAFSWLLLAQAALMTLSMVIAMRRLRRNGGPLELGMFLVIASVVGFFAAYRLTVDKVGTFTTPDVAPSCNFSVLVQCGKNLKSWQGSLFGFPNPLLGLGGWTALLVIGILIVTGVSFSRWFWIAANLGVAAALVFVAWLIHESIFDLATLCPWCMTTWAVVIPSFWAITFYNLKTGHIPLPRRLRSAAETAYAFVPLITLVSYVAVAVIAQLRLDVINHL